MKSSRWLPMSILIVAVLSLYVPAAARAAEGHFARTLQVSGPVDLEVQTGSGTVDLRTGDSSTVRVTGTIRSSNGWFDSSDAESKIRYLESNPPIEQHGNLIKIGHVENHELEHNVSISYEIVVPTETRLRSNTGSGEQSISGLHGPVEASSGSGHLRLTNIGDEVRVSTGSGRISVDGAKGRSTCVDWERRNSGHRRSGRPARLDGQRQRHPAADRARRCGGEYRLRHAATRRRSWACASPDRERKHCGGRRRPGILAALHRFRQRHGAPAQPARVHAPGPHGFRHGSYSA